MYMTNTLRKAERLNKKKIVERMFAGGANSFAIFPLRVVYLVVEETDVPVSILISVSKRRFKRAVKRNRVKRQIREAYRKNKVVLSALLEERGIKIALGFLYLSDKLIDSTEIETKMKTALLRIGENIVAISEDLSVSVEDSTS